MCSTASAPAPDCATLRAGRARGASAQRPAFSMPNVAVRRRRGPPKIGLRSAEGTSSARSPAKLSETTSPRATSSASASSTWVRSKPDPCISSSKKDAPLSRMVPRTAPALKLGSIAASLADKEPHCAACRRASSVIGVVRTGPGRPSAPFARPLARPQPRPGETSGKTAVVEPGRLVAGDPRRQDFRLPRRRRGLETFELADDFIDRVGPLHPRSGRDALPQRQKAQKIARADRLDFAAQALDGVVVDAGQQPALTPFLDGGAGRKAAAHGKTFGLESRESTLEVTAFDTQQGRKRPPP